MVDCRLEHLGIWLVEDRWFASAVEAVRSGALKPDMQEARRSVLDDQVVRGPNGMAILEIQGHMTKGRGSFGGTGTVAMRRQIRELASDDDVTGILIRIESPGGIADGTYELARDVAEAAAAKPVRAHIEDLGASAAYYVASQTSRITANAPAEIGSIGAVAVLVDSSGAAEQQGLRVHVISTGPHKGAGAPGSEITEDQLRVFQERIDDLNAFFLEAVREGRGFTPSELARVSTGRVWIAEKALALGLIDAVATWDDAVGDFARALDGGRGDALLIDRGRSVRLMELELELGPAMQPQRQPTTVQTLIFAKERFTREQAVKWARDHDFRADKVDETERSFRLRQFEPSECRPGSFRTMELDDGVQGVICRKR